MKFKNIALVIFVFFLPAISFAREPFNKACNGSEFQIKDGLCHCPSMNTLINPWNHRHKDLCKLSHAIRASCESAKEKGALVKWSHGQCYDLVHHNFLLKNLPHRIMNGLQEINQAMILDELKLELNNIQKKKTTNQFEIWSNSVYLKEKDATHYSIFLQDEKEWLDISSNAAPQGDPMEIALLCKDFNIPLGISIDEASNSIIIPKPDHLVKIANSFMEIIGSKVRFYLARGEIDNHKYAKRFIEDYQFPISDILEDGDATFFLHDSLHHILGFGLTKPHIMERARQNLKISLDFKKYASETLQNCNRSDLVKFISSPEFKYAVNGQIDRLIGIVDTNSFNAARESWDAIKVTEEWFNGHDQIPLSKLSVGEILSAPEKANAEKISFQYLSSNLKYIEGIMGYTFGMIIPGLPKLIPGKKFTLSGETLVKLHSCLKDNDYVITMLSAILDVIPLTTEEISMYEMLARNFWKANSQKYPSVDTHDVAFDGDDLIQVYLERFSSHLHAVEILQKLSQKDVKSLLDGQKKFSVTYSKISPTAKNI